MLYPRALALTLVVEVETALFAVVVRRDLRLLCLTAPVANAASLSAGLALG